MTLRVARAYNLPFATELDAGCRAAAKESRRMGQGDKRRGPVAHVFPATTLRGGIIRRL